MGLLDLLVESNNGKSNDVHGREGGVQRCGAEEEDLSSAHFLNKVRAMS